MYFEILSLFLISLVSIVIIAFKWRFNYWNKRNIYTIKPAIPSGNFNRSLFGKATPSVEVSDMYKELRGKGLKYGGFFMLFRPFLLVADLDLMKNMLVKDFQNFSDRPAHINEKGDPLSGNLFNLKGTKWKVIRVKLTPTFSSGSLKMMFETIVNCTKQLSVLIDDCICKHEPIDMKETMARYIIDIIGSVAYGIECNCLKDPDTEFRNYGKRIIEGRSTKRKITNLFSLCIPQILNLFNISTHDEDVEQFFRRIVKETIDYREKSGIVRNDFMHLLNQLRNKKISLEERIVDDAVIYSQDGLSLDEIAAHVFAFFLGGYGTSSTTLTHLMFELVMNPEIQEILRNEINRILEKHDGEITYDAIMEMNYLDKCFLETMRKHPSGSILTRTCTKDYKVSGSDIELKEGDKIFFPVYGIHHDPEYYPDPDKFDPERFTEEEKSKRDPITYLAFGGGPRTCIALRFATIQIKVAVVAMLRNFKFTLSNRTQLPLQHSCLRFFCGITNSVWLNAERV